MINCKGKFNYNKMFKNFLYIWHFIFNMVQKMRYNFVIVLITILIIDDNKLTNYSFDLLNIYKIL